MGLFFGYMVHCKVDQWSGCLIGWLVGCSYGDALHRFMLNANNDEGSGVDGESDDAMVCAERQLGRPMDARESRRLFAEKAWAARLHAPLPSTVSPASASSGKQMVTVEGYLLSLQAQLQRALHEGVTAPTVGDGSGDAVRRIVVLHDMCFGAPLLPSSFSFLSQLSIHPSIHALPRALLLSADTERPL